MVLDELKQQWKVNFSCFLRKFSVLQILSMTFSPDGANREQDILAIQVFCESIISFHTLLSVLSYPIVFQHTEGGKGDHERGEGGRPDQADVRLDRHPASDRLRPRPCAPGVHRGHAGRALRHELGGDGARD